MKPELADREPIAYHELGHATAYRFYGYKVSSVEVGDDFGCTRLAKQAIDPFEYIVASCAGKAAVDRWFGWKAPSEENWRKSQDHHNAYQVALKLSQGDLLAATMLIQWAEKVAEKIIAKHWDRLHAPAMQLVERGTLKIK